jgi:hypothetical protein
VEYAKKNEPAAHGDPHGGADAHGQDQKPAKKAPTHGALPTAQRIGGLS